MSPASGRRRRDRGRSSGADAAGARRRRRSRTADTASSASGSRRGHPFKRAHERGEEVDSIASTARLPSFRNVSSHSIWRASSAPWPGRRRRAPRARRRPRGRAAQSGGAVRRHEPLVVEVRGQIRNRGLPAAAPKRPRGHAAHVGVGVVEPAQRVEEAAIVEPDGADRAQRGRPDGRIGVAAPLEQARRSPRRRRRRPRTSTVIAVSRGLLARVRQQRRHDRRPQRADRLDEPRTLVPRSRRAAAPAAPGRTAGSPMRPERIDGGRPHFFVRVVERAEQRRRRATVRAPARAPARLRRAPTSGDRRATSSSGRSGRAPRPRLAQTRHDVAGLSAEATASSRSRDDRAMPPDVRRPDAGERAGAGRASAARRRAAGSARAAAAAAGSAARRQRAR